MKPRAPSPKSAPLSSTGADAPLIVTALLDPASAARFERERQAHFPPGLNLVPAHVSVFHHLPGAELAEIEAALQAACSSQAPSAFTMTGVRFLGRGVAYALAMPEVAALRRQLAQFWHGWLTAQDRQAWQPHVTLQNKAEPSAARDLHRRLEAGFDPQAGQVLGLTLWRYRNGPWQHVADFNFGKPAEHVTDMP